MNTTRMIAGQAGRFYWRPAAGLPTGDVLLTVSGLSLADVAMAPLLTSKTVTAVASDLRTLTLSGDADASIGGTGRLGVVFVDLGIAGRYQARVEAFVGADTVRLVSPLPLAEGVAVDSGAGAMSIHWLTYFVDLTAEQVGSGVLRSQQWSVAWTRDGGSIADQPDSDSGLLDIVRRRPSTGLTHFGLVEGAPHLQSLVPPGQESYAPQIERALAQLEGWVRRLLPLGRYPDQVDFGQWIETHQFLTLALLASDASVAGFGTISKAADLRAQAREAFDDQPVIRWIDADDDGVRDSGESDEVVAPVLAAGDGLEPEVATGAADPWDLSRAPWADL